MRRIWEPNGTREGLRDEVFIVGRSLAGLEAWFGGWAGDWWRRRRGCLRWIGRGRVRSPLGMAIAERTGGGWEGDVAECSEAEGRWSFHLVGRYGGAREKCSIEVH